MDGYLKDFDVPAKHPSEAALKKWRNAVSLVKNHRRRFRHVADLEKRSIHQNRLSKIKKLKGLLEYKYKLQGFFVQSDFDYDLRFGNLSG